MEKGKKVEVGSSVVKTEVRLVEDVWVWDPVNPFAWVAESVKGYASVFDDELSVAQLGSVSSWVRGGSDVKLKFLLCTADDRVFHRGEGFEFFFIYSCIFVDLGVRFPFSEFECGVLMQLKCAPSQLHPNSWAFVRGFEILMSCLEVEPSLEVFFALFQCKGVRRGCWLNLASVPSRAIFSLYRSSYKGFKSMFLKVGVVEGEYPWFVDECLLERFPLFWVPRPRQILGMNNMEYRNEMLVEFLVNHISSSRLLSVVELLDLEGDNDALDGYIVEKAPKVTSSSLRAYFRTKNVEKQGSTSQVMAEKGAEVNQPSPKKVNFKRKRGGIKKGTNIGEEELVSEVNLDQVKKFTENQKVLHSYRGDGDLTSLWSEHFPFTVLADDHVQNPSDVKLIHEVGEVWVAQYLQVIGARLMCVGRTEELKRSRAIFDKAAMDQLMRENVEKSGKLREALDLVNQLEEKLKDAETSLKKSGEEKAILEARIVELGVEKKQAEDDKENHGLEMFAAGFDRAVEQAKFLVPGGDLSRMDLCKVVVGDELVEDDDDVEGQGENPVS